MTSAAAPTEEAVSTARPRRLRRAAKRIPTTMWVVTALWGALLVGASLLWPMTYGYDEVAHFDMAYAYSAEPFHFYEAGALRTSHATLGFQRIMPAHPARKRFIDVDLGARSQRPSLQDLGGHTRDRTGALNQMVQHPPLYYELAALVMRIPGVSHLSWDLEFWLVRLASVLMLLPVPLLCWGGARRLLPVALPTVSRRTLDQLAVAAGVVPVTMPNLIRDGSSVTNDALLICTTSVVLYLLCRVITGDLSRRTAAGVAIALAAALLTKGFALVLPAVVLGAYLVGIVTQPGGLSKLRHVVIPLGLAAVGGVIGGLWWLRNLVKYGKVQPNGLDARDHPVYHAASHVKFVPQFLAGFTERLWGGIGYADVPRQTAVITFGIPTLLIIGLLLAVIQRTRRNIRWGALVLIAAPVLTTLIVASGSWNAFRLGQGPRGAQGRYIYQTIAAVAAIAIVGWMVVLQPRIRVLVAPVLVGTAILINFSAWTMLVRSWYPPVGPDSFLHKTRVGFNAALDISPLPVFFTVLLVVVLPAAASVAAMVATVRSARELRADDETTAPIEVDSPPAQAAATAQPALP